MKKLLFSFFLFFAFSFFAFSQDIKEYSIEKNIKTFIALPTDSQYLDILSNEIDTLTNSPLFSSDVLFWNAKMCMFNNTNDTAFVISRVNTKHVIILRNLNWRKKENKNFLIYFKQ